MKILSWNVNSIRKNILESLIYIDSVECPDILCFQETKCTEKDGEKFFKEHPLTKKYPYRYWNDSIRGHYGVSVWCKKSPINVFKEIIEMPHCSGRVLLLEFEEFTLLNTYVPNTGMGENAELRRTEWHNGIYKWLLQRIEDDKFFIWCGDLNVVREPELDTSHLKYRKKNNKDNCGGMKIFEYEQLCEYLNLGLFDVFRTLNEDVKSFTWYSNFNNKVGWRLDYFLVNDIDKIKNIVHLKKFDKSVSDHSPLYIQL
jgi:exodeoxyribonuclease III